MSARGDARRDAIPIPTTQDPLACRAGSGLALPFVAVSH
jgi:hypothetical protein